MAVSLSWDGRGAGQGVLTILFTIGLALLFTMAVTDTVSWAVPSPIYPETPVDEAACKETGGTWEVDSSVQFPFPEAPPAGLCVTAEVEEYEQQQAAYDFWSPLIQLIAGAVGLFVALLAWQLGWVVRLGLALGGVMLFGSYGGFPSFLSVYIPSAILPLPESTYGAYGWVRPLLEVVLFVLLAAVAWNTFESKQRRLSR